MTEYRYYHGTKQNRGTPFSSNQNKPTQLTDSYRFWVYPKNGLMIPINSWETNIDATAYCNNHIDEGNSPDIPILRQIVCLGHSDKNDMAAAENDLRSRGLINYRASEHKIRKSPPQKKFYHGCNIPREFPNGTNCFYTHPALQYETTLFTSLPKWHTHKQPHIYCSNHTEIVTDKPNCRKFICNGHHTESDMWINASHQERNSIKSRPEIVGVYNISVLHGVLHQRFETVEEQIYELEKGLEKAYAENTTLQNENTNLKALMDQNINRLDEKLNQMDNKNKNLKYQLNQMDNTNVNLKCHLNEIMNNKQQIIVETTPVVQNDLCYDYVLMLLTGLLVAIFAANMN